MLKIGGTDMCDILPKPISLEKIDDDLFRFERLNFSISDGINLKEKVIKNKFKSIPDLEIDFGEKSKTLITMEIIVKRGLEYLKGDMAEYQKKESYLLTITDNKVVINFVHDNGLLNALSTLKSLILKEDETFTLPHVKVYDFPNVEVRSISTTFAWYAGYSRIGFDSQLWDFEKWKNFVDKCSDLKINQLNLCMYGYWPFKFDKYPETTLSNIKMKIWSKENEGWIEIFYSHPNIVNEFLPSLIEYANERFIRIFAYIGLNSYNGGYAGTYKDRRSVSPSDEYINDFDSLCLSIKENVDYLKESVKKIAEIGFNGIIFEESEESQWYCSCPNCKEKYLDVSLSPADAKHKANYELLKELYKVIRAVNPNCEIGLRAWREEPVEKEVSYLKQAKDSIPNDVYLYWAPGPYNPESEFEKWVNIFGSERICARDQESNAYSACFGRLFYMFKDNVFRPDKEHLYWSLDNDIDQYLGSVRNKCRGINGYVFEYYQYFLHLFAASQYGWNAELSKEEFYKYALNAVFGKKLGKNILEVYRNIKIIHESQLPICELFYPFLRHKIGKNDLQLLYETKRENSRLLSMIRSIINIIENDPSLKEYELHFKKLENSAKRNDVILDMCFKSIEYELSNNQNEKRILLEEIYELNERNFNLIKDMYFDVMPVDKGGVRVSCYPYHEIKRTINNILYPDKKDPNMVYLGIETLGWMWI